MNPLVISYILKDIAILDRPELRIKAHLQLLEYCDARRKAIDILPPNIESQLDAATNEDLVAMGREAIAILESAEAKLGSN